MKKFTLLELLIVISIIGILASFLLPSLSKARAKAVDVVCKSNLKQNFIATELYTSSNNGNMIVLSRAAQNDWSNWKGWAFHLAESGLLEISDQPVYLCPKAKNSWTEPVLPWHKEFVAVALSYGINWRGTFQNQDFVDGAWSQGSSNNGFSEYLMTAKFSTPDEVMYIIDTKYGVPDYQNQKSMIMNNNASWNGRVWTIHNPTKRANTLFVDGHVNSQSISFFQTQFGNNLAFAHSELD